MRGPFIQIIPRHGDARRTTRSARRESRATLAPLQGGMSAAMRCWLTIPSWLALGALAALPGQQPGAATDELSRHRLESERLAAAATRSLDDAYKLSLRQLERQRAEAGDYEGAEQAWRRLETLEKASSTAPIVAKPPSYVLSPARATVREGASVDGGRGVIEFKKTGSKATWEMLNLEPGAYHVRLTYSVGLPDFTDARSREGATTTGPMPGGLLSFGAVNTSPPAVPTAVLQKRVSPTGSWHNFITETLGRYEFPHRSASLRVEAVSASEAGLMQLKQIELIKAAPLPDSTAATNGVGLSSTGDVSPAEAEASLQSLKRRQRDAERAATSGLRLRYLGEFDRLERELSAQGESAAAARVARARASLFTEDETTDPATTGPSTSNDTR